MKNTFFISIGAMFIFSFGLAQNDNVNSKDNVQEEKAEAWLKDLHTANVIDDGDKLIYNEEAKLILSDPQYYKVIYPKEYNWVHTRELMKRRAIKPAIWTMINLYGMDKTENAPHVVKSLITLDQLVDIEKALISSYYSYIPFDPEVVIVENGKVKEFTRPDIAEEKLNNVKELTVFVLKKRQELNEKSNKD